VLLRDRGEQALLVALQPRGDIGVERGVEGFALSFGILRLQRRGSDEEVLALHQPLGRAAPGRDPQDV